MSRRKMVTRTIRAMEADVLFVNIETKETFNKTVILPKKFGKKKPLDVAKLLYDNGVETCVAVLSAEPIDRIYAMDEEEFIKSAHIIDKR